MTKATIDRRAFLQHGAATLAAAGGALAAGARAEDAPRAPDGAERKRMTVGVIGCGSVSTKYLPHLAAAPHVELVSVCDRIFERAKAAAAKHQIPNAYPHIDQLLAGAKFDLLVNLTDMQEHEHLNRTAIGAGKHVWSEKPIANSLEAGQELLSLARKNGVRIWGAPTVVDSPQFRFMAQTLASSSLNALGRVAAAHASYGHVGPTWSAFFYEQGGGSMPDLGVYNLTTLTGLLGPAKSVVAMTSIVTPTRQIQDKGEIDVAAEDNATVLIDHGNGVISHVQCGFNYYTPAEHEADNKGLHTITIHGKKGCMALAGYDWAPHGVDLATRDKRKFERHATDAQDYTWENGAARVAQCLLGGDEPPFRPEHALHVVEIITAARKSQETGARVPIRSTFDWPIRA